MLESKLNEICRNYSENPEKKKIIYIEKLGRSSENMAQGDTLFIGK